MKDKIIDKLTNEIFEKEIENFKNEFNKDCFYIKLDMKKLKKDNYDIFNYITENYSIFKKNFFLAIYSKIKKVKYFYLNIEIISFPYENFDIYDLIKFENLIKEGKNRLIYLKKIQVVNSSKIKSYLKRKTFKINCKCLNDKQKSFYIHYHYFEEILQNSDLNSYIPKCKTCNISFFHDKNDDLFQNFIEYEIIVINETNSIKEKVNLFSEMSPSNNLLLEIGEVYEGIFLFFTRLKDEIINDRLFQNISKNLIKIQIQPKLENASKFKNHFIKNVLSKLNNNFNKYEINFNDFNINDLNYNSFLFNWYLNLIENLKKQLLKNTIFIDYKVVMILIYQSINLYFFNDNINLKIGIIIDSYELFYDCIKILFNNFIELPINIINKDLLNFFKIHKNYIIVIKNFHNLNIKLQSEIIYILNKNDKYNMIFLFERESLNLVNAKKNDKFCFKSLANCIKKPIYNFLNIILDSSYINNQIINKNNIPQIDDKIIDYLVDSNTYVTENKKNKVEKSVISFASSFIFNKNKNLVEIVKDNKGIEQNIENSKNLLIKIYSKLDENFNKDNYIKMLNIISRANYFIRSYVLYNIKNENIFVKNFESFDLFISLIYMEKSIYSLYGSESNLFDKEIINFDKELEKYFKINPDDSIFKEFEEIYSQIIRYIDE